MNDVKLRDQRKPGHCWQDNELYDAFGPVIGPNAVTVYTHMTRQCYGTEIRSSSRELARDSGLSKDTVLRSMRAMERIGMLRNVGRGSRSVAEYHLVDLKELAESHGGVYDRRRVSYVFSEAQTAALKAIATGAVGDSQKPATVAVGDSGLALCETDLAHQKPTTGAPEAHVSFSAFQDSRQQDNPPPTPARAGVASELIAFREKQRALAKERGRVPCSDCWEGRCTMNCGPAIKPAIAGPDPPQAMRMRRRRGPSDGCSAMEAMR